jgi:hypothetical protein
VLWLLLPNAARSWWFVAGGRVLLDQAVAPGRASKTIIFERCRNRTSPND